ncbi:helix-turn-helix domain-containing protein [Pseudonocardia sp. GCM10023141]|uniref:helix-turn-helix domain-containing protein n=1 Tax=Pseudonocardia sp. GCM10023141 TaxID=3252653 RepID=UPI0036195D1F
MTAAGASERPAMLDGAADVGARVTALRGERGLSLSALARRASIGKATLSGLENGSRNPTLDTLYSVAAALGVPITAIVGTPAGGGPSTVRGSATETVVLHVFDDGPVTYELCRIRIPAGATQRSPAHHPGVTEHITVFSGALLAGPVDAPLRAGPGEHIAWPADVPHLYAATPEGDVAASLLIRSPRTGETAEPGPRAPGYADRMNL